MAEQLPQDDFKPLVPVYGAYPIPAVLASLEIDAVEPNPEDLIWGGRPSGSTDSRGFVCKDRLWT